MPCRVFHPPRFKLNYCRFCNVHSYRRNLALRGDCQQLSELADTFELIPELMANWDDTALERIRSILKEYQCSHAQCGYEYASLLDGDDAGCQSNGFNVAKSQGDETKSSKRRTHIDGRESQ